MAGHSPPVYLLHPTLNRMAETPKEAAAETLMAAVDEPAEYNRETERLRAEVDSLQDQLRRQAADFQNYRRRTEQEKAGWITYGQAKVVERFLDVLDDFGRSLAAGDQLDAQKKSPARSSYHALRQGLELVYRKFEEELTRMGVTPIEAVGQPFNVTEHEALMQQPAPEGTSAGIVLAELQRGYRMGDRVLRHSKVVVSV